MGNKIPVARMWHKKGKNEYFCFQQILHSFPNIEFEFHIVLDDYEYRDEWSDKIDSLKLNVFYYSKSDMENYVKNSYGASEDFVSSFKKFVHFYHLIIGHYLRRVYLYDYMLTYEYDVIFKSDADLSDLNSLIDNKIPFGIHEPMNANCDKALYKTIENLYGQELQPFLFRVNPTFDGINAGFQGVNLKLFDEFLSVSSFQTLCSVFDFSGIYKDDGTEKWGWERTTIDTQEQSFYSLMNQIHSEEFSVLNKQKYFFKPCWEDMDGYIEEAMKSDIIHFTGHKKANKMFEIIEERIKLYEQV